jgi:hypothetical protein
MRAFTPPRIAAGFGAAMLLSTLLASPAAAVCGDGVRDGDESCDGADLGGTTCADVTSGFAQGGTLTCKPDCTFETSDCRRAFIESLIPASGGGRQNRCHIEWGTVGTTAVKGRNAKRSCQEADPTCDQDQEFNNSCTFRVQLCLNVPDPRVGGCNAGRIVKLDVLKPPVSTDVGREVVSGVLAAAQRAAPDQANISGSSVSFGPPVTDFTCGSSTFRVPLRGTSGRAKPGIVKIKARTSDNTGRVRAVGSLTLVCNP